MFKSLKKYSCKAKIFHQQHNKGKKDLNTHQDLKEDLEKKQ